MNGILVEERNIWPWGLRLLAINIALGIVCAVVFLFVAMACSLLRPTFLSALLIFPLFAVLFVSAWSGFGFQLGQSVPGNAFLNGLIAGSIAALPFLALGSCWGLALMVSVSDCMGDYVLPSSIFAAGVANPPVVGLTS
ncbi:MAG: hypothetical protein ACE5OS_10670 [Anaerolineae bacterium]